MRIPSWQLKLLIQKMWFSSGQVGICTKRAFGGDKLLLNDDKLHDAEVGKCVFETEWCNCEVDNWTFETETAIAKQMVEMTGNLNSVLRNWHRIPCWKHNSVHSNWNLITRHFICEMQQCFYRHRCRMCGPNGIARSQANNWIHVYAIKPYQTLEQWCNYLGDWSSTAMRAAIRDQTRNMYYTNPFLIESITRTLNSLQIIRNRYLLNSYAQPSNNK